MISPANSSPLTSYSNCRRPLGCSPLLLLSPPPIRRGRLFFKSPPLPDLFATAPDSSGIPKSVDHDDVLNFTLSSPARKICRLDADLPPMIQIEEPDMPLRFEQHQPFSGSRSSDASIQCPIFGQACVPSSIRCSNSTSLFPLFG